MTTEKLLIVFTSGPYSCVDGQEALDLAFIGAAFEQDVSLLFLHDGVFQINAGQQASKLVKQVTKAFAAANDFGIDNVYAHDLALVARGLVVDDLVLDIKSVNTGAIAKLIAQQDRVLTF